MDAAITALVEKWRNEADAAKEAGRRYEARRDLPGAVSAAKECYAKSLAYETSAQELADQEIVVYVVIVGTTHEDIVDAVFTSETAAHAHREALSKADLAEVPNAYYVIKKPVRT